MRKALLLAIMVLMPSCGKRVSTPLPAPQIEPSFALPRALANTLAFDVGLYSPPGGILATDWRYFAKSGMITAVAGHYGDYSNRDWPAYLDAAEAAGMKIWLATGEEIFSGDGMGAVNLIRPVAGHPALAGAVIWDEPVWNMEYRMIGHVWPYGVYTQERWLKGISTFRRELPGVKLMSPEPYVLVNYYEADVKLQAYYRDFDYLCIGYYSWPMIPEQYELHRAMVQWARGLLNIPILTVVQGFQGQGQAPILSILRDMVRGSLDGGAWGSLWWMPPSDWPDATYITDPLWRDIVQVSQQYGRQPVGPERYGVFLPMVKRLD